MVGQSRADRLMFSSTCLKTLQNTMVTASPREVELFEFFLHSAIAIKPGTVIDTEIND